MSRDRTNDIWAKTVRGTTAYHPLFCHLVDVGWVAHEYLASPDTTHIRDVFARLFGMTEPDVRRIVPFLVSSHDLGKASPSFERKAPEQWRRMLAAGWPSEVPPHPHPFRHDREAAMVLADMLKTENIFAVEGTSRQIRGLYRTVAFGLGGHHGQFYGDWSVNDYPEIDPDPGCQDGWTEAWRTSRKCLIAQLRTVFGVPSEPIVCRPDNLSALAMLLCGFTILCDWIGSDQEKFPAYAGEIDQYPSDSRSLARRALHDRRLLEFVPIPPEEPRFSSLFPMIKSTRPLQQALDSSELPELPSQVLAIVEAPTGEGKTEAALLLASRLAWRAGQRGFYFALPSMATSNQMGARIERFLCGQLAAGERAHLLLVHGQAGLSEQLERLLAASQHDGLTPEDRVIADSWLLPRKRSLLSPYGTGTVDQALVCALNVRHGALRIFGLVGKVVIIDEVHAYDLYMSTILDRLLEWLRVIGASVILLSATLPSQRRKELIAAFKGAAQAEEESPDDRQYPLITIAVPGVDEPVQRIFSIPVREQRAVQVERWPDGPGERNANAVRVLNEMAEGGCAAWICNTVGEAQAVYQCLKRLADKLPSGQRTDISLFHARFPLGRRTEIEKVVLEAFGPEPARRPARAILVGTQVIEQSLDLDFDLMVSQLAPIDLLIQRLGRLQRHDRKNRALRFTEGRRLILLDPPGSVKGDRSFGGYAHVYEPWLLYKTLVALSGRDTIRTPVDVRPLVEAVYDDALPLSEVMSGLGLSSESIVAARAERDRRQHTLAEAATMRLLNRPSQSGSFLSNQSILTEDDEAEESDLVSVQTRYARPSVRAILLDEADPLFTKISASQEQDLDTGNIRDLLLRSVTLQHAELVKYVGRAARTPSRHIGQPVSLDGVRGLTGYVAFPLSALNQSWQDETGRLYLRLDQVLGILFKEEEQDRG